MAKHAVVLCKRLLQVLPAQRRARRVLSSLTSVCQNNETWVGKQWAYLFAFPLCVA